MSSLLAPSARLCRRRGACLLAAAVVFGAGLEARAEGLPRLTVQRTQRTTDCPDAETLAARVSEHMGQLAFDTSALADRRAGYDVQILADESGYVAMIRRAGRTDRVRTLSDPGPGCAGLSDALSVTLAILLDQAASRAPTAAPPRSPPRPAERSAAVPVLAPERLALDVAGAGTGGLLVGFSPALVVDVGARPLPRLGLQLGLVLPLSQRFDFPPGAVDVSLTLGLGRVCLVTPFGAPERPWGVSACAALGVGSLRGEGVGYPISRAETRTWVLVGGALETTGPIAGPLGWVARLDLLAPTTDERFGVDGLPGDAFDPPPLAGVLGLGLRVAY